MEHAAAGLKSFDSSGLFSHASSHGLSIKDDLVNQEFILMTGHEMRWLR
jgi:hypothetical protein